MRNKIALFALFAAGLWVVVSLASTAAMAHGGKSHKLMGTVKTLQQDQLTVTVSDGPEKTVGLTAETKYEKSGKPAQRGDLVAGVRVSIQLSEDDKTAVKVKIGGS